MQNPFVASRESKGSLTMRGKYEGRVYKDSKNRVPGTMSRFQFAELWQTKLRLAAQAWESSGLAR